MIKIWEYSKGELERDLVSLRIFDSIINKDMQYKISNLV